MKRRGRRWRTIFAVPGAIGASSLLGLFLGLTGDGLGDLFAWLLVGLAPFTMAAVLLHRSQN